MSLSDFVSGATTNTTAAPLTKETLDAAIGSVMRMSRLAPRHDCRFDGHVAQVCTTRCVHCGVPIRALTPDENHLLLGEFE